LVRTSVWRMLRSGRAELLETEREIMQPLRARSCDGFPLVVACEPNAQHRTRSHGWASENLFELVSYAGKLNRQCFLRRAT
jgi:hypothetical protein